MTPLELVLSLLPDAKKNGRGWRAKCPAHEDHNPSLSISTGSVGRVLLHCHAGCSVEAIVSVIGLKMADLMPERDPPTMKKPPAGKHGGGQRTPRVYPTAADAVAALARRLGRPSATWTYTDAAGEPVGLAVRWDTPDGKTIRPIAKVGDGWIVGTMPEPRVPYSLPELLARPGERVFICEGEKAADAAARLGLLATTSSGGAKAAAKTDWKTLSNRDVVILVDNDAAGEQYGEHVKTILLKLGCRVRIVRLPGLPTGGDIVDFIEGLDSKDDADIRRGVEALAEQVASTEPSAALSPVGILYSVDTLTSPESRSAFPVDALPGPLRGFVIELAAATGNDPSAAALAALVVVAGCIGNRLAAQVKLGWIEVSVLWGAIVARSGTAKSAVLRLTTRPLVEMFKESRERFAEALTAYQSDLQRYEAERDRWKASQRKGGGACDPPIEPDPPTERRLVVSDVTSEKLAVLSQDNPHGLLACREELAAWVGSFDRYAAGGKGSDAPTWLSFFDAAPVIVDRKGGAGTIFAERAAVSVLGTIQPGVLRRVFGAAERESGLLARVLLVEPPTQPVVWTDAELSSSTAAKWANLLRHVLGISPGTDDQGTPRPRLIPLTVDAKAAYVAWHDAHGQDVAAIEADDLAAHLAKLKGMCIRLALMFAAVDAVTTGEPMAAIGLDHIGRAINVADWFKGEARRVYGTMRQTEAERSRRRLLDLIDRKGGSISGRELVQSSRAYRSVADAEAALAELVGCGLGAWRMPEQRGAGAPRARRFVLAAVYSANVYRTPPYAPDSSDSVDVGIVDPGDAIALTGGPEGLPSGPTTDAYAGGNVLHA
jgi:hypothetical protein